MESLKHYSIGLLLLGMGLIAGSCVPIVQTIASGAGGMNAPVTTLSPEAGEAVLELPEPRAAVPVVRITPVGGGGKVRYSVVIAGPSGRLLLRERGEFDPDAAHFRLPGDEPQMLDLRLPRVDFPSGRSTVRLETEPRSALAGNVELRLVPVSAGLMTSLATALVLAILGWLAAALGALQWIRAEAARPAADGEAGEGAESERLWRVGCHLSPLLGYLLPFGHLIGPAAIWLWKRRTLPGVERAGRDVLNFQLSVSLYVLAGLFLSFFLIGLAVLFVLVVLHFSMTLVGAMRAQRGVGVRYPLVIRFI
jgi:uncharacterized Tic20 family protein